MFNAYYLTSASSHFVQNVYLLPHFRTSVSYVVLNPLQLVWVPPKFHLPQLENDIISSLPYELAVFILK
jgi:hypothetical protein